MWEYTLDVPMPGKYREPERNLHRHKENMNGRELHREFNLSSESNQGQKKKKKEPILL